MSRLGRSAEWRFFAVLRGASASLTYGFWALIVLRGALPAAFAVAMGVLVGAVQRGDALGPPLAVMAAVFVAMQGLGPLHDAVAANLGARATNLLHERLLAACTDPPGLAHLEHAHLADDLSAAREFDLGITGPNITVCMPNIAGGFAAMAGGAAQSLLLFGYRWWAPLLVGGAWVSTHWLLKHGAMWRARQSDDVVEKQRRAGYAYNLTVQPPASKEVRLFGLADWVVGGFTSIRRALLDQSWEARRLGWRRTQIAMVVITGANIVFFWALARSATAGDVSVGALVVFAQAAIGASTLAFGEVDWWFRTAAQPVPMVLDLAERMRPTGALPAGRAAVAGAPATEIRFRDVRFAYPTTGHEVFAGFDLTIPAGRSMAIVGQNGAGKTTLAKLLCRMYDPDDGALLVDGIDLRHLDLTEWRSRIAAVFQDFVRYELPLRDNVAPAGAPDEDILGALAQARADGLASPDTILSRAYEGGTDLSGGQWQRVALARALCAVRLGAGVVILDEPTAQLDVRGEAEIFDKLLEATRGCTTILISHRFSTVRRADCICVLEDGRVVELGSHDDLMAAGGRYRTMFELQASRFDEPEVPA